MDVIDVLHKIGYTDLKDFGKDWRTKPLYRASGNSSSLSIVKETGQWYDFSSRQGGGLMYLVKLTLGLATMDDAQAYLGDETFQSQPRKNLYELTSIKQFDKNLLVKLLKEHEYWLRRGISKSTLETFDGGITYNGRMAYRYVFPILNPKDELVGFSGRSLNNNPNYPKWKHIGSKSHWLYPFKWNKDIIAEKKEVILVESIGDMLALWDNGIRNTLVTFGLDLSPAVIKILIQYDMERVFLGFNNDADNELAGNLAAEDAQESLLKFFDPKQIIMALPESKDFGEMTAEQIKAWKSKNNLKN